MNHIIKQEIENVMLDFSTNGKVFFNETNFQNEFAIEIEKRLSKLGNYELTLEYSPNFNKYRIDYYFDVSAGKRPLKVGSLFWNKNCPKYNSGKTIKRYPNKINIYKTYNFSYIKYIFKNYSNFKYLFLLIV